MSVEKREAGWLVLKERVFKYPWKRISQVLKLLLHFRRYRKFLSQISMSSFKELSENCPAIRYKFVGKYAAEFLSTRKRLDIIAGHYSFLDKSFADSTNRLFPSGGFTVWSREHEGNLLSINLAFPGITLMEGEFCMVFRMNRKTLHTMTFTIVPGEVVGLSAQHAIFIGGSQGTKGHLEMIRYATKAMGEICPAKLLLLSLQGLGRTLGISSLIGVSCQEHVCKTVRAAPNYYSSIYDSFWILNGAEPLGKSFKIKTEISEKPSTSSSASHRARARRKRLLKHALLEEMMDGFAPFFKRPNGTPRHWKPHQPKIAMSLKGQLHGHSAL